MQSLVVSQKRQSIGQEKCSIASCANSCCVTVLAVAGAGQALVSTRIWVESCLTDSAVPIIITVLAVSDRRACHASPTHHICIESWIADNASSRLVTAIAIIRAEDAVGGNRIEASIADSA